MSRAGGIYAVVKCYETEGAEFKEWTYRPDDYYSIHDRVLQISGGNHELAIDAASWCELADKGEVYSFDEGEIEIIEIE